VSQCARTSTESAFVSGGRRRIAIRPWEARTLADLADQRYDAVLSSLGYEARSTAIPRALAAPGRGVAVGFPSQQELAYPTNERWYRAHGYHVSDRWENRFLGLVRELFADVATKPGRRIAVDVSSMERPRVAAVVETIASLPDHVTLDIDLLYAPARYQRPSDLPSGALSLTCVSPYFSGVIGTQAENPVALIGLGYEPWKAAGALLSLEVDEAIAFAPSGFDRRFYGAMKRANRGLLSGPHAPHVTDYDIADPAGCFAMLDGTINAARAQGSTPLLVPLGPKVFAACACLAAAVHHPHVTVWRASFLERERASRRSADGNVCGITISRQPAPPGPA
jgi:hypothetical protein